MIFKRVIENLLWSAAKRKAKEFLKKLILWKYWHRDKRKDT